MPVSKASARAITPAAKGDLAIGSGTNAASVLAVGTNNYVLTADSTQTTGVKWAAVSAGGLVKITTTSFSGATTGNVDSIFSSTYTNYLVVLSKWNSSANAEVLMRLRNGSSTETSANYYGSAYGINSNATLRSDTYSAGTSAKMGFDNQTGSGFMVLYITGVGNSSSDIPNWTGSWSGTANYSQLLGGQRNISGTLYDGLQFLSSSGNVSATVSVYGLVK